MRRKVYHTLYTMSNARRVELIGGDFLVAPAPGTEHLRVLRNLLELLSPAVRQKKLGEILPAPCDVVLTPTDVVQPDLLFVSRSRVRIIAPDAVQDPLAWPLRPGGQPPPRTALKRAGPGKASGQDVAERLEVGRHAN
ncbi:MAG: Uma2 family endonuclease [Bacillota bacterium]